MKERKEEYNILERRNISLKYFEVRMYLVQFVDNKEVIVFEIE